MLLVQRALQVHIHCLQLHLSIHPLKQNRCCFGSPLQFHDKQARYQHKTIANTLSFNYILGSTLSSTLALRSTFAEHLSSPIALPPIYT